MHISDRTTPAVTTEDSVPSTEIQDSLRIASGRHTQNMVAVARGLNEYTAALLVTTFGNANVDETTPLEKGT
jgi:hypothetical protein